MRVTSGKSRVRESRLPGSVRAEPNGRATRPRPALIELAWLWTRWQPGSQLSQWFSSRVAGQKGCDDPLVRRPGRPHAGAWIETVRRTRRS